MTNQIDLSDIEVDDDLLGYGDILAVNATLIEFLMFFGYYKPADSNEPNQLLNEMTKFSQGGGR